MPGSKVSMKAYRIKEVKNFMGRLLGTEAFDAFLLAEASITTYNTFHVDGRLRPDYYSQEEQELLKLSERQFSLWQNLRPFCLELIKGQRTPLSFRFTLQLSPENTKKLLAQTESTFSMQDIGGLILNIRYDAAGLFCTTAVSLNLFTMDKSLEHAWDQMVQRFFLKQDIRFTLP